MADRVGVAVGGGVGAGRAHAHAHGPTRGSRGHKLMVPPPGYKFIPRTENVCQEMGCFECYDIYCERCESKDRRIIELEMRNTELVKHITLLQARLFPRDGSKGPGNAGGAGGSGGYSGGASGAAGGEPFAYVQSPVMYDPGMGIQYQATTTFSAAGSGPGQR
eukprot:gb/GFBE01079765.1/.p1 GENE.gb/GFBE01079765.1/~~gb/GFBE01079765.1/.p1  ORF type:complete len:163 (+),score=20.79 gb/GFBE01079765.1/:1-489(+)